MEVFVARQPIFDRRQKVFAYELLYRNSHTNKYTGTDGDIASLKIILEGIHGIGLETLTSGKKAFVNFTGNLLVQDVATILPKEQVVVEILEDVKVDDHLIERCRQLKKMGYTIALDDFIKEHEFGPLVDIADIIKVDFMGTDYGSRKQIIRNYSNKKIKFLAEKVETKEEFDEACLMGFSYFQGYFFSKPVIINGIDISPMELNYLELLKQVNATEPNFTRIAEIVEHDLALSYKILRIINSAAFGFRKKVSSIQQALVTLGLVETRKWAALFALKGLGSDNNEEVVYSSLLRAKMMEIAAVRSAHVADASELFLMGLFSMIDVILNKPMQTILEMMPLSDKVKYAMLTKESEYGDMFNLVLSYERGDWDAAVKYAAKLKIRPEHISDYYISAVNWIKAIDL